MSLAKKADTQISEDEYLQGEIMSEIKHEYIAGNVYAMAVASATHNLISGNVFRELSINLKQKNSPCDIFSSDMKVKVSRNSTSFFYPDVMIVCDTNNEDEYYQNFPVIIVEVLSKSTRKNDKKLKKLAYFNIPTLSEYVIIEQDYCEVEVFRKNQHWQSDNYFLGDEITFESIDTTISVEDIYYHVKNEDMLNFLEERRKSMEKGK